MEYSFDSLDKESLTKLYSEFGLRSIEIGSLIGITDDAVLRRLKVYGIPTNLRDKKRQEVTVIYTGKRKDKKKQLTTEELIKLCNEGYSDEYIGKMYNMTGEGVAYRRKSIGIEVSDKFNLTKKNIEQLKDTPKEELEYDYYNMSQEEFSDKYNISKNVWRPYLTKIGTISKSLHRINSYPKFNKAQRSLLIGSLLGDGSVSGKDYYYESHSNKQKQYLLKKYSIMEPYSCRIVPCDLGTGTRIATIHHPNFREFYKEFYEEGLKGKLIPVNFIKENWDDSILAYWFLDDGYYDDVNNEIYISNYCPKIEQLEEFLCFLNVRYRWNFRYSFFSNIYNITFSKEYYESFYKIISIYATPDLYYKIPEKFLTKDMVKCIDASKIESIKPKFYRLASEDVKKEMSIIAFNYYKKSGFPYLKITEKRLKYLIECFKDIDIKITNRIVEHNTSGSKLCEYFFPNIYECYQKGSISPFDRWEDDKALATLIKNRLTYADRFSDATMRTGIKLIFNAVTNFKPTVAKLLYNKYATNGRVYDYSCGFGARMLGALSLGKEYVGCEPNLKTYNNLNKFGNYLKESVGGNFFITDKGSEEFIYKENYFDFAFSSPPFFDYEIYSQDPGQSIVKFPKYEDWLINYWKKTIQNCYIALTSNGYFGVCVSINKHEHLIAKTKEFCEEIGLFLVDELKVPYKQLFANNENKYDLIRIYKKI